MASAATLTHASSAMSSGDQSAHAHTSPRGFTNLFTEEHDAFIISLKIGGKQSWTDIARLFNVRFPPDAPHPPRTAGGLQVRYSRNIRPKLKSASYRQALTDAMAHIDPEFGVIDESFVDMPTPPTIKKPLNASRKRKMNSDAETDSDLSDGEASPSMSRKSHTAKAPEHSFTPVNKQTTSRKKQRLSPVDESESETTGARPSLILAFKFSKKVRRLTNNLTDFSAATLSGLYHDANVASKKAASKKTASKRAASKKDASKKATSKKIQKPHASSKITPTSAKHVEKKISKGQGTAAKTRSECVPNSALPDSADFTATREKTNAIRLEQVNFTAPRWLTVTKEQWHYLLNDPEVPELYRSAAQLENRVMQYAPHTGSWGTRAKKEHEKKNFEYKGLKKHDWSKSLKRVIAASCKLEYDLPVANATAATSSI